MKILRRLIIVFDRFLLMPLVINCYPTHPEGVNNLTFLKCAFFQKVLGFNRAVPWPVHFTSKVISWERIKKGRRVNPGYSPGNYIQAINGILFGSNVRIGPNVSIISANHDNDDYDKHFVARPIEIGNNVWIGANAVILPGVHIGDNVVIGAGSVVTHDIPPNSIAAGNPCKVIRDKQPYQGKSFL